MLPNIQIIPKTNNRAHSLWGPNKQTFRSHSYSPRTGPLNGTSDFVEAVTFETEIRPAKSSIYQAAVTRTASKLLSQSSVKEQYLLPLFLALRKAQTQSTYRQKQNDYHKPKERFPQSTNPIPIPNLQRPCMEAEVNHDRPQSLSSPKQNQNQNKTNLNKIPNQKTLSSESTHVRYSFAVASTPKHRTATHHSPKQKTKKEKKTKTSESGPDRKARDIESQSIEER